MKLKLYFLLFAFWHLASYSQTLDANNSPAGSGGGGFAVSPSQNVGQSFLAGLTGPLTQVNVYFQNFSFTPGDFRLTIYSGDGYGGSILGTQNFTLSTAPPEGEFIIPISSSINVSSGNTYTMRLDGITGSGTFLAPGGATGPYADGILYFGGGSTFGAYDLWFKTFVTLPAQGTHLNFDGVDDFVILNHYERPNQFTVEAWVKTSSNLQNTIMGWGTNSATFTAEFKILNGQLVYAEFDQSTGAYQVTSTTTTVNDNNWHHVSVTRTNTPANNVMLYIDGVIEATGTADINTVTTELSVGAFNFGGAQQFFNGSIDEIRIWNTIRTSEQINGSKNCELQGNELGLLSYYNFNQGIANGTNTSETSLTDNTSNGNNGALTNFTLLGTSSNWLDGSPVITGSVVPSVPSVTTPVIYTQGDTATPLTATVGANGTSLLWYTSATGGTGTTTAPTPSTATAGSTSYWVSSTNANGCESERQEIVVTVNAAVDATHLNFDGINDSVDLGSSLTTYFTGRTEVTLEAWVRSETTANLGVIVGNYSNPTSNSTMQMLLRRDGNSYNFWVDNGSGYITVSTGASSVAINTWQHVAGTWDGTTMRIYLDGVLASSTTHIGAFPASTNEFAIGYNAFTGANEKFDGDIDDLRVWDVSRTIEEINGSKNCELQGSETGLLAYYNFNQGTSQADNSGVITLLDNTSNAYNGTLTNFTLNGATSNWLAGSVVTTGSIVPSAPTVTSPVTYNQGDTATPLTATVGANGTSLLWYTSATGGTGSTTAPTPSTATAGSTSYWVSSVNANGCESDRAEIVVNVIVPVDATHLNFDGTNDRVDLGNSLSTEIDPLNTITVEAYIRPTTLNGLGVVFGNYAFPTDNGQAQLMIRRQGSDYAFYVNDGSGLVGVGATNAAQLNTWTHVAGVWNGSDIKIYIDGALINTTTGVTGANFITLANSFSVGFSFAGSPDEVFRGDIDEIRVWSTVRTESEINSAKSCELQGNEIGLLRYYKFNQGVDMQDNSSVTSLSDSSSSPNNGNLIGFTLNGGTSNWLAGSPIVTGSIIPSVPTVTTPVAYNEGDTAMPLSATVGANGTSLLWYTSATGGTGTTTAPTPSTATAGSTSYWVSSTNANGCESERVEIVVNVSAYATHLNFDGVNDRVTLGSSLATSLNGANFFTVEAVINIPNTTGIKNIFNNHDGGVNTQFNLRVNGNTLEGFMGFGTYVANSGTTTLSANTWYHVAMVFNDTTLKLYLDGSEVASTAVPLAYSVLNSTQNYQIGASGFGGEFFIGDIDEVRVWNRALPVAEILNNMNCELPNVGTQNGLLRYYQFNQGFDSVNNTSVTILPDLSSGGNNGNLTNFALTGANSNWKSGSAIITGSQCLTLSTVNFSSIDDSFKLYPNPTSGILKISNTKKASFEVDVIDINGRVLMSKYIDRTDAELNLNKFSAGVYLIRVQTTTSKFVKRIIKQ